MKKLTENWRNFSAIMLDLKGFGETSASKRFLAIFLGAIALVVSPLPLLGQAIKQIIILLVALSPNGGRIQKAWNERAGNSYLKEAIARLEESGKLGPDFLGYMGLGLIGDAANLIKGGLWSLTAGVFLLLFKDLVWDGCKAIKSWWKAKAIAKQAAKAKEQEEMLEGDVPEVSIQEGMGNASPRMMRIFQATWFGIAIIAGIVLVAMDVLNTGQILTIYVLGDLAFKVWITKFATTSKKELTEKLEEIASKVQESSLWEAILRMPKKEKSTAEEVDDLINDDLEASRAALKRREEAAMLSAEEADDVALVLEKGSVETDDQNNTDRPWDVNVSSEQVKAVGKEGWPGVGTALVTALDNAKSDSDEMIKEVVDQQKAEAAKAAEGKPELTEEEVFSLKVREIRKLAQSLGIPVRKPSKKKGQKGKWVPVQDLRGECWKTLSSQ